DGFISANHCALAFADGRVLLRDLGSSNGTYVRIRGERELRDDDFVLIGNQMLRVELR
ncbi:MAG: FHA domain-containing protein, partial [Deltaproteobacteria bacterium]|nr:FHA domain-containing protein [Deltaproteobacteria bacterium]